MDRKEFKNIFDELNPTELQTEKIWNNISEQVNGKKARKKRQVSHPIKYATVAVLAILVVCVSGIGINAATDGKVVSAIQKFMGIPQSSNEIINQAEQIEYNGEVYAPDIIYLDEDLLVFGNLRGVLLYDLKNQEVFGTIDIQANGCIYFEEDVKRTCVVKDGNSLVFFNSENEKPYGNYYKYKIEKGEKLEIEPSETGDDETQLNKYYKQWKDDDKGLVDTFDKFQSEYEIAKILFFDNTKENIMYGEKSRCWTSAAGEENISFLCLKDNIYTLYTYRTKTKDFCTKELKLKVNMEQMSKEETQTDKQDTLPEFVYTGDDLMVKAISQWYMNEARKTLQDDEVWIPSFEIFEEVKSGNEYLVFGNFSYDTYHRVGNILEAYGGGEEPACIHLKKQGEGYQVVRLDIPRDGAYLYEDIKEFSKDYPEVYEQYIEDGEEKEKKSKKARKEYLQMYVLNNHLDVEYYKDFGWNAEKIFDE